MKKYLTFFSKHTLAAQLREGTGEFIDFHKLIALPGIISALVVYVASNYYPSLGLRETDVWSLAFPALKTYLLALLIYVVLLCAARSRWQ